MTSNEVQDEVRKIIGRFLGYSHEGNLILIFEDAEHIPHIMSNAPNRAAVDAYLRSLLDVPSITRNNEGETVQ